MRAFLSGSSIKPVNLSGSSALVSISPGYIVLSEGQTGYISVTNPQPTSVAIKSIKIAGGGFSQTNNCSSLAPGAGCTITVYWFGTLSLGQVTIVDASGIPQYVGLTGE